jgi:hypothetical protein
MFSSKVVLILSRFLNYYSLNSKTLIGQISTSYSIDKNIQPIFGKCGWIKTQMMAAGRVMSAHWTRQDWLLNFWKNSGPQRPTFLGRRIADTFSTAQSAPLHPVAVPAGCHISTLVPHPLIYACICNTSHTRVSLTLTLRCLGALCPRHPLPQGRVCFSLCPLQIKIRRCVYPPINYRVLDPTPHPQSRCNMLGVRQF